ncbi:thiol-disulfide oxidoreductase DCC family protein [Pedobacter sp. UBA5917]|jgi:predicted DCC family thiol-disulfide oxidoreductase YuxK|uniref:thiol-disulfide oxidoreductase DCC family protein n=1 Tax=Pedobacter sp. UBA5917 TaxID=1947061 RepID=UPI0025DBCAF5|nr:DCC1-like thiol-disulfide oxidoreductase family protein [Pedobacter sp. UBA5917]
MAPVLNTRKDIILFDGVCNFCNRYINYIIAHDGKNRFSFAPLESETASALGRQYQLNFSKLNSIVVISKDRFLTESKAVLHILKNLNTWWSPFVNLGYLIPGFIRNWLYKTFAHNRYALFGQADSCMVPTEEVRGKFLI